MYDAYPLFSNAIGTIRFYLPALSPISRLGLGVLFFSSLSLSRISALVETLIKSSSSIQNHFPFQVFSVAFSFFLLLSCLRWPFFLIFLFDLSLLALFFLCSTKFNFNYSVRRSISLHFLLFFWVSLLLFGDVIVSPFLLSG